MGTILMMSAKIATLGPLKTKLFWNKNYDIIVSVHDIINKILSRDLHYFVDVIMCPKSGSFTILMREVTRKTPFLRHHLG